MSSTNFFSEGDIQDYLELSLSSECFISGGILGYDHVLRVQETYKDRAA